MFHDFTGSATYRNHSADAFIGQLEGNVAFEFTGHTAVFLGVMEVRRRFADNLDLAGKVGVVQLDPYTSFSVEAAGCLLSTEPSSATHCRCIIR